MEEKFDYNEAIKELERIAEKVEDPATPISDIDGYLKKSAELIAQCRTYLRTNRTKLENFE